MFTTRNTPVVRISALTVGLIAAALALTACAPANPEPPAATTMADQITASDVWIKEPTSEMAGMFGMLENGGSTEVVLVGGSSEAATMVEVHEVVDGQMQKIEGGLSIGAGAMTMLEPGGNHLMLMGLTSSLLVGEEVTVTLEFSDGSTKAVTGVVKSAAGGEESYNEESGHNMGM